MSTLHQFLAGAAPGDAITEQALAINRWLRELGFVSHLYALHVESGVTDSVRPLATYRRARGEEFAILHHSIGSDVVDTLLRQGLRLILVYHNVTPPEFFHHTEPYLARLARQGQEQLELLRAQTALAIADSRFNATELLKHGYRETSVLPITLYTERYDLPGNADLTRQIIARAPNLLFIGRLAANKRQEDLVKLLYFVRRARPDAHLYLVGEHWQSGYAAWVTDLAEELGVSDGVTLTGKVSQMDMVTYLKSADLYVSMSEHEGFGVPLIESMYLGLPVMAYDATAVAETLGGAGILFRRKRYAELAELIDLFLEDEPLRRRVVERQRERVQAFLEPAVRRQFVSLLERLNLC